MSKTRKIRGGRRKSAKKSRRSRKGGNLLGTAVLPFGLLMAQKSYQNRGRRKSAHRSRYKRRR